MINVVGDSIVGLVVFGQWVLEMMGNVVGAVDVLVWGRVVLGICLLMLLLHLLEIFLLW